MGSRWCGATGVAGASRRPSRSASSSGRLRQRLAEIVTWTQRGNEGMRALNERLGYEYRDVSVTMVAPLPLQGLG